jgi:hypothetical protein
LFYGQWYNRFYIGSNGYITFGDGDTEFEPSLENHFSMPRISGVFTDLTPPDEHCISYKKLIDRVAVTFQDVPVYGDKNSKNSFQIEMFYTDGAICITWLDIANTNFVAGLSRGIGIPPALFQQSDLSEYLPCWPWCDISKDYYVNFKDFAIFANHWLEEDCTIPFWCGKADMDLSNTVDYDDLSICAAEWLTADEWWLQPVSHWKFDEGSGDIAYDSAGNNDGNLIGDTKWVTGKIGSYALEFDGSGDYVQIPDDDSLTPADGLTVSAWIYINEISWSDRTAIVNKYYSAIGDRSYALEIGKNQDPDKRTIGWIVAEIPVNPPGHLCYGTTQLQSGQWYHIAATFEPDHQEIYVNGIREANDVDPAIADSVANNNQPLYIGYSREEDDYFNGVIDDVRIYDRRLSAGEIEELYREGLGPKASNPSPADGQIGVDPNTILSWTPGISAISHDVYFGTNYDDVNDANTSSEVYMGNFDISSFDPCGLETDTTYYWRIDEIDRSNIYKGNVWSFKTWVMPNLVSWWKFDEGSGDIAYDSAGNNDGNLIGDTKWVEGKIGSYALEFDGNSDFVEVPDDSTFDMNDLTIAFWMKSYDSSRYVTPISNYGTGNYDQWYGFEAPTGSVIRFLVDDGSAITAAQSTTNVFDGQWHFVAGTRSSAAVKTYINGQLEDSVPETAALIQPTMPLWIGGQYSQNRFFNGVIDDVRIYDRALSAEEIEELYHEGLGCKAYAPNPSDGATNVDPNAVLSWSPGKGALSHDVYLGTNFNDVNDANTSSAVYMGNFDVNSFDPCGLELKTTYYWRIDELDGSNTHKGDVWSFRTWVMPNLVSWWKFDEGQGDIAYDSAGDNDGTIYGATWTSGQIGGALDFDGDDYVEVADDESIGGGVTSSLTVSMWLKSNVDLTTGENSYRAMEKADCYFFLQGNDGPIGTGGMNFLVKRSNSNYHADIGTSLNNNQWYHLVGTFNGTDIKVYLNGILKDITNAGGPIDDDNGILRIGSDDSGFYFDGTIDDVRIYDRALSAGEIEELYREGLSPKASNPSPADGAAGVDPNTVLSWTPGKGALSHDVYLGTNFNDVNNANTSSAVYMGNFDISSFDPCSLEKDTTYYWRIDELDGSNICKGDVWSFKTWVMPNLVSWWKFDEGSGDTAYDSTGNYDGTLFGDATWAEGKIGSHALEFDGSGDYVDCGDIDEIDASTNFTFTAWINTNNISNSKLIARKGEDYPPCYFWVNDDYTIMFGFYRGPGVYYTAATTETITPAQWYLVAGTYDGQAVRTYINGQEKAINTNATGATNSTSDSFRIGSGYPAYPTAWFDGKIDDIRIYDRALSEGEIQQLYEQGQPHKATNPNPEDGATGVDPNTILSWSPGKGALSHDVYLGTSYDDVSDANTSSAEYMGNFDVNHFDPCGLETDTTYYWRIDEFDGSNIYKGDIWNLTTWELSDPNANLVSWWKFDEGQGGIAYDSAGTNHGTLHGGPTWTTGQIDGGLDFDGVDDYVQIPDDDSLTPSDEITIAFWIYNRDGKGGGIYKYASCPGEPESPGNSRAYAIGVNPNPEVLYVGFRIFATASETDLIVSDNPVASNSWHHIAGTFNKGQAKVYVDGIPDGSKTMSVSSIMNDAQPLIFGGYWSYCDTDHFVQNADDIFDDIRIYNRALSEAEIEQLYQRGLVSKASHPNPADEATDVDPNTILSWSPGTNALSHDVYLGTDYNDVSDANTSSAEYMGNFDVNHFDPCGLAEGTTYYWRVDELDDSNTYKGEVWSFTTLELFDPNLNLVSLWKFDEGSGTIAYDAIGNNDGNLMGDTTWVGGKIGSYALEFDGSGDYVEVPDDGTFDMNDLTIAFWMKSYDSGRYVTPIINYGTGDYDQWYGFEAPTGSVIRFLVDDGSAITASQSTTNVFDGQWYFITGTRSSTELTIYINGQPEDSVPETAALIQPTMPLWIGGQYSQNRFFNGVIDDVRIYDKALTDNEVELLYLMGN